MDNCYNPDYSANTGPRNSGTACTTALQAYSCYAGSGYPGGNVRLPFGLVYLMAVNNIPISIILNPAKGSLADADFSVTPPSGSSTQTASVLSYSSGSKSFSVNSSGMTGGTKTVYYSGMPLIVDGPYAAQALQVIANFNSGEFAAVPLHIANYPFTAPVLATIASRPKPVLIDGSPLDTFFAESGIPDVVSYPYLTVSGSGTNWTYTWPTALGTQAGCGTASGGFQSCNSLAYTSGGTTSRIVDVLWNHNGLINAWTGMGSFFQAGGTVMTLADASTFESTYTASEGGKLGGALASGGSGAQQGPFCSASPTGVASLYTSPGSSTDYPASDEFLQIGTMDLFVHGQGGGDGSGYTFSSAPAPSTHALTNGGLDVAIAGFPYVGGTQTNGRLLYLGSLNSWHGGSAGKDGGLHIMYNSLLAFGNGTCGSGTCVNAEFARSSPVSSIYGEYYRGSFDWKLPSNTNPGTALYQPPNGTYPYSTGHFREFKAGSVNTAAGGNTSVPTTLSSYDLSAACDSSSALSPCNWDAASLMKTYANRNIYVVTPGGTNMTTAAAATTPTGWAAVNSTLSSKLTNGTVGVLGGADYGSAAVIEPKATGPVTIAGAAGRPTIAYLGARDGMLHAFCVAPGSTDTNGKCYNTYARGEEIWAIIPPGIQNAMITANASGDWSKINLGGAIRVADLNDTFTGESTTGNRTILIVGTRDLGYVDAFDISNPKPGNQNTDGFRFLWENDGTSAASGSPPAMGQTMGASVGLTNGTSLAAVAFVTASPKTGNGIITYGMQVADGKVFAFDNRSYSMTIPLAGGSTALVPNDIPSLPTIVDTDSNGNDDTLFVTDFQGGVQKIAFTSSAFTSSAQAYTLSTNANGCGTNSACQPIGASPAVTLTSSGKLGVLVVSGGSDSARSFGVSNFYMGGFDAATNASLFTAKPLGTLSSLPEGVVPTGGMPLRAYAALTISGTAAFSDTTTLAINDMQQVVQPILVPGQYGDVRRWDQINGTPTNATSALALANNYTGGYGSIVEVNNGTTGTLISVGTSQSITSILGSTDAGLANATYHIGSSGGITGRNFTAKAWFDLAN
jgi:hypothetical protein